uniref:Cytochrome c biogenesis protein CcsA n=1 Tax=Fusochloris perforata TaxID=106203 RepID=A0A097KPP5_9CHLO|nr:heme attachment to plastid cytochrome c [Fusochloris perforata]AIT95156.1 heme attachment to plastid cytochrome c [Fusochloris perforata]
MEPLLQNISFCVLFLTMLFFLIKTSLTFGLKEKVPTDLGFDLKVGTVGIFIANITLGALLTFRWIQNGYFPLSNLYESLMFLSWSFTTLHLFLENLNVGNLNKNLIGIITSPLALFTNAFANFSLPLEMQKASSLVPALQSNWLMMHVTVMMLSYATLLMGCVLSIAFLVISSFTFETSANKNSFKSGWLGAFYDIKWLSQFLNFNKKTETFLNEKQNPNRALALSAGYPKRWDQQSILKEFNTGSAVNVKRKTNDNETVKDLESTVNSLQKDLKGSSITEQPIISLEEQKNVYLNNFYFTTAENLDNLSYRVLGIGFPLLTLGILSGAVWANEAWGSYWSWDPKETWAFITWLVFAVYFHARITKGWQGKKPALLASIGFLIIWICYLGVNLLGKGLHSYGWINFN